MKKYYFYVDLLSNSKIVSSLKFSDKLKLVNKYKTNEYAAGIVEFSEDAIEILKDLHDFSCSGPLMFFDRKGYMFRLNRDGTVTASSKRTRYSYSYFKMNCTKQLLQFKYTKFIRKHDKKQTKKFVRDCILSNGIALWYPAFKRLKFYNCEDKKCCRFRLHIPKEKGKYPLILFLHGAGAPGMDNFQQIWEVKNPYKRLKNANKECFILAPQLGYDEAYNTDEHSRTIYKMISEIDQKYGGVDFSKIYILGVSYGGYGAIYECFRHPERYAAAVPTVGWIYHNSENQVSYYKFGSDKYHLPFDSDGIATLAKTPMWLACSHIEAKHNEALYKKLKEIHADVKLTRNDKYGHGMHVKFFKNEPWDEWIFGKEKNKVNS